MAVSAALRWSDMAACYRRVAVDTCRARVDRRVQVLDVVELLVVLVVDDDALGALFVVGVLVVLDELVTDTLDVLVVELDDVGDVPPVCRPVLGERLVPATCVLPWVWITCFAAPGTACCRMCQRASSSLNTAALSRSPPSGVKWIPSPALTGTRLPVPSGSDAA
jgi:hypothetical protein